MTATTPRSVTPPAAWRDPVTLAEFAPLVDLADGEDLADLAPPPRANGAHNRGELMLWALCSGRYNRPFRGRRVIGAPGIAAMLGLKVQTVRLYASRRNRSFPRPVFTITPRGLTVPLYDLGEVRAWGVQIRALAADGVTPQRRRRAAASAR